MRCIGVLLMLAGCYDARNAEDDDGLPADDPGDRGEDPREPEAREPEAPEVCGPLPWVEGRSEMTEEGCLPIDPTDSEWYGCRVDEIECWAPPDRVIVGEDGGVRVQFGARCASRHGHDVKIDGVTVPPNRITWDNELYFPPGVLVAGAAIDLETTPGAEAVFRIEDDVALEPPECCHDPDVTFNHGGDRHAVCYEDWRTFTVRSGDLRFHGSRVNVVEADLDVGGALSLRIDITGCADGETAELDFDASEAVPANCCFPLLHELTWQVGEGGALTGGQHLSRSYCCGPPEHGRDACLE